MIASRGTGVSPGGIQGAFFSFPLYLFHSLHLKGHTNFVRCFVCRSSRFSLLEIYVCIYISLFLFVSLISSTLVDEILWHLATCPSSGIRSPTKRPPTRHIRVLSCQVRDAFWACALALISRERARTVHHRYCIQTYAKGREFCSVYTLRILLRAQTRVLSCYPQILSFELPWKIDQHFHNGARNDASPSEKRAFSFSISLSSSLSRKIRKAFSRRIGVICVTRVKIYYYYTRPNRSFLKSFFFFRQFTKLIGFTYP